MTDQTPPLRPPGEMPPIRTQADLIEATRLPVDRLQLDQHLDQPLADAAVQLR